MGPPARKPIGFGPLIALAAAVVIAGCGGDEETTATSTTSSTVASSTSATSTIQTDTSSSATATVTTGPAATSADAEAQSFARSGQTAIEVYATDNNGSYTGIDAAALREIEPSLPEDIIVSGGRSSYSITVPSPATGNFFTIERSGGRSVLQSCSEPGVASCGETGEW